MAQPRQARTKASGKSAGECATTCAIFTKPPRAERGSGPCHDGDRCLSWDTRQANVDSWDIPYK